MPSANTSDPTSRAIVSALYDDLYTMPAATLGYSLRTVGTSAQGILFHIGRLSARALNIVRVAGWELLEVERILPPHDDKGIGYRFVDQYTKLHLWSLDSLLGTERVVYADSDALAWQNFDELFEMSFPFGAAIPHVYGNTGFKLPLNAGVLALRPNQWTFLSMLGRLDDARYRPGEAEQAFLNLYLGADVIRLPYVYSANLAIRERSPAIWYAVRDEMCIAHYMSRKPFAKDSKDIVDGSPLERLINKVRHHRDGMHAEAIGWWQDAFNEFWAKNWYSLQQCDRLS
jgi:hypothetical protein